MAAHGHGALDALHGLEVPDATAFALFSAALGGFALLLLMFDFVPVLDHANLAFHEAGHLLFRVLGETASLYGGTLMQFVFPLVTCLHFLRRGRTLAAAACAAWGCENLGYTAVYMADARANALPLVGGGEHDWTHILGRWGLLEADTTLAGVLDVACYAGLAAIWWAVWRLRRAAQD